MNHKLPASIFIMAAFIAMLCLPAFAAEKAKPLRITWEKTEGSEKYQVQIADSRGSVVLDRTVTENYIEFILPVGMYKVRIAAINILDRISFWSEWDAFEVRHADKWEFFTNDYIEKAGIKISAGKSYIMHLPMWSNLYLDTFDNYKLIIGLHFGNSKYFKSAGFLRYTGIEIEGNYSHFKRKKNFLIKSELKNATVGLNFFVKTNLKIPLNFFASIGGGGSFSRQIKKEYNISAYPLSFGNRATITFDPYARAGAGIEFNFLYALSLNIGADFSTVFYLGKIHNSLRYYALLGVRI